VTRREEPRLGEGSSSALAESAPRWDGRAGLVRDEDGRTQAFDRARIATAVRRAQADAGDDDPGFADEVAAIVALALARGDVPAARGGARGEVPQELVGELVERALVELGRAPVARAYIVARARRQAAREALRAEPARPVGGRLPDVRGAAGTAPWNPARIVAALVEEAGLPRERAHEVAERVEARVAGAGLRRLSTGLVRELVSNELLALGLDRALRAHEALGVPRFDLKRLFQDHRARRPGAEADADAHSAAPPQPSFEDRVAGEVLRRSALEDLLGDAVAERHRTGDHHLVDLDRPHRVLWRALPAELLLRREPSPTAAYEVALDAATLASECAHGLVLEDFGKLLAPATRAARGEGHLREVLLALAAAAAGARRHLDLARPSGQSALGSRAGAVVGRLVQALDGLARDGLAAPRLFLGLDEVEAALAEASATASAREGGRGGLEEALERLLAAGRVVPVWHGAEGHFAAPGVVRRPKDRAPLALGAAVALNLPRLARRAGPWREESLLALVADAARLAIEGLVRLDQHQREVRRVHGEPVRERAVYGVVPVGLDEALRILGDGAVRPAQGARVLGLLADAAARFAAPHGLVARVTALPLPEVAARFAELDAGAKRAEQPRLFSDLPRPEDERTARYGTGFDLPSLAERHAGGAPAGVTGGAAVAAFGRDLGELLGTLPSGALQPFAATARFGLSRLAAWRSFEERRTALDTGPKGGPTGTLY